MIDASSVGEPGELRIRPLSLPARPSAVGTHYTTPEELAILTATVYGQCPPIVIVTMTGANFAIGEQLSAIVTQRIPLVRAAARQVCANFGLPMCKLPTRDTPPQLKLARLLLPLVCSR